MQELSLQRKRRQPGKSDPKGNAVSKGRIFILNGVDNIPLPGIICHTSQIPRGGIKRGDIYAGYFKFT